jgi:hypothetical protein
MGDLLNGVAHVEGVYSLGAAVLATVAVKKLFNWLNKDKKTEIEALNFKIKTINHIVSLAEKAVPPAYLRSEIAKIGNHNFAY